MKRLMGLLALSMAPAAFAQTPDGLCGTLDAMVAAEKADPAYTSLVADWKPGSSMGRIATLPAGMPEGARCSVYVAGTTAGVVGGGQHNYAECILADTTDKEPDGERKALAVRDAMASRVGACLARGWTAAPMEKFPNGRGLTEHLRWSAADKPAEVVVEFEPFTRGRDARSMVTTYTTKLQVRSPNPSHKQP